MRAQTTAGPLSGLAEETREPNFECSPVWNLHLFWGLSPHTHTQLGGSLGEGRPSHPGSAQVNPGGSTLCSHSLLRGSASPRMRSLTHILKLMQKLSTNIQTGVSDGWPHVFSQSTCLMCICVKSLDLKHSPASGVCPPYNLTGQPASSALKGLSQP